MPSQIVLDIFDGRPVYHFRSGRKESIVYADTGEEQTRVGTDMAARIDPPGPANQWRPPQLESLQEVDQWTGEGPVRTLRPLWKYAWPKGEQAYVSGVTGDVVQYTTSKSRFWAYLGTIPALFYFTPLRKD